MRKNTKRLLSLILTLVMALSLCPAAGAAPSELQFSDALVTFIENGEGFRAMPYGGAGGWYIGYGCSCDPAAYPNGITEAGAEALLRERMETFADSVRSFLTRYGASVTQQQFDAMCAMSYALGPAWLSASNRLPSYIINGADNYTAAEIASAFAAWCHVGGMVSTAALERRIMEANIFLRGNYSNSTDGFCWLMLDAAGGENALSDVAVYPKGEPYGALPEASRSGWYFAGWKTSDGHILRAEDPVVKNLSLTATWSSTPVVPTTVPETPTTPETPETPETPTQEPIPADCRFPDVLKDAAWCAPYVNKLAAQGVINGYEDGTFRPNNSVTWGESLKLILLASGYPEQVVVAEEGQSVHWAQGYLDYAEKKGFVAPGTVTNLDKAATRNEIADLCAAALDLASPGIASPFADTSRGSVLALYQAGILEGSFDENGNRIYKGGDKLRRSEICAILVRVADYVDQTLILFNGGRYDINTSLRPCPYDEDCFYTSNGRVYYDDGKTEVHYGIDVSYYQGDVNWHAVAADGIDFALLRCGYRGYGGGDIFDDEKFEEYVSGALAAGLDVGVYFFSQATTVEEAKEEAKYTLSRIRGYRITYPIVFDWEPITSPSSRTRYYDGKTVTDCTIAFCDAIAAAGYTPMTYFNQTLAYTKLDLSRLQKYAGWYAYYHEKPNFAYDFQMWQYGSSGSVNGIPGRVDMNISFVDFAK